VIPCKSHKILTFPSSLAINITDIDQGEEWGGAGSAGGGIQRRTMFADEPPYRAGRKQPSEGCRRREAGETMVTSWTVGVLALVARGRDSGGGRTAAVMLPILHHGEEVVRVAVGCW
jgi:hypothetical protein